MTVEEFKLTLIVVDEQRVILLVDDRPPIELDEAVTQALTRFLTKDPEHVAQLAALKPAPEQHWRMPRGITRNVTAARNSYPEAAHPLLHAASHKVLRAVAELGRPVHYREVREHVWAKPLLPGERKMPSGTVGSQLFQLAEEAYLLKQRDPSKPGLIYTLTPLGEDVLTRPNGYLQEKRPVMKLTKRRHADRYQSPAEGRCDDCGRMVSLPNFTNSCSCGAEYNSCGQRLGPRRFWGEDTGEHPADIARIK